MPRQPPSKGGDELELLIEKWLYLSGWKVHRARRAGFVRTAKGGVCISHDLFGCFDFLAFRRAVAYPGNGVDWPVWAIQVCTKSGRSARRRKIEEGGPWPPAWRVTILTHEVRRAFVNAVERENVFVFENYAGGEWKAKTRSPILNMGAIAAVPMARVKG